MSVPAVLILFSLLCSPLFSGQVVDASGIFNSRRELAKNMLTKDMSKVYLTPLQAFHLWQEGKVDLNHAVSQNFNFDSEDLQKEISLHLAQLPSIQELAGNSSEFLLKYLVELHKYFDNLHKDNPKDNYFPIFKSSSTRLDKARTHELIEAVDLIHKLELSFQNGNDNLITLQLLLTAELINTPRGRAAVMANSSFPIVQSTVDRIDNIYLLWNSPEIYLGRLTDRMKHELSEKILSSSQRDFLDRSKIINIYSNKPAYSIRIRDVLRQYIKLYAFSADQIENTPMYKFINTDASPLFIEKLLHEFLNSISGPMIESDLAISENWILFLFGRISNRTKKASFSIELLKRYPKQLDRIGLYSYFEDQNKKSKSLIFRCKQLFNNFRIH